MNNFNSADFLHPEHLPLLTIATQVNEATSVAGLRDGLHEMAQAIRGKPIETKVMAYSFMLAALGADLLDTVEQFVPDAHDNMNELIREIIAERAKLQEELNYRPIESGVSSNFPTDTMRDFEEELRASNSAAAFELAMAKVRPLMAGGSLTITYFVEKALTNMLISSIIPDYLTVHPNDEMTASRYSLWWLIDSLLDSANPMSYYDGPTGLCDTSRN